MMNTPARDRRPSWLDSRPDGFYVTWASENLDSPDITVRAEASAILAAAAVWDQAPPPDEAALHLTDALDRAIGRVHIDTGHVLDAYYVIPVDRVGDLVEAMRTEGIEVSA